ncbi:related to Very-long-chain enoyl-CoA reductase [Hanseniaspora guilliermondii]|uniref:Related to Very-long-chain enoyl-CoA reductase n=1 Tax=Hanseniaspora guilliermondii TaxID=56406 RepID=A0A1L0CLM3_9ASCO|nr:related to Very-long-chain enoyl-CoA reductase [Hanseniaspora guilliermondii]
MSSSEINIKTRSKKAFRKDISISYDSKVNGSIKDLTAHILEAYKSKLNPNRIRLTVLDKDKQVPLSDDLSNISNDVYIKDLGPQISWRLVFMIEYFGPILIHSILYQLSLYYNINNTNAEISKTVYYMHLIHYAKREFESIFVHSFSNATMPLFNVFKNSFHYWILNGLIGLGYLGYGFNLGINLNIKSAYCWGVFTIFELCNFFCHIKLRLVGDELLKKGIKERKPINESFFKVLVSPNYTFEVLSWVVVTLTFNMNLFAILFLLVSSVQMYLWAMKKNKKYGTKKAFLIPYIF